MITAIEMTRRLTPLRSKKFGDMLRLQTYVQRNRVGFGKESEQAHGHRGLLATASVRINLSDLRARR